MSRTTVLVVSPHPDDELIPAGGTLLTLCDAGWRVVNLACSLGFPAQHVRRERELRAACARAGFELDIAEPSIAMSAGDDLTGAQARATELVADGLRRYRPGLVLAPGPTDAHHAHELVSRAVREAVQIVGAPVTVWWWELWGYLHRVTLLVDVARVLDRSCEVLEAHAGELARNDYAGLVRARAKVAAVLGAERVFGFGAAATSCVAAELLSETVFDGTAWRFADHRTLERSSPSVSTTGTEDAGWFLAGRTGPGR
jgi:LmbE family N-acetylglucosaminyl deacetylase